MKRRIRVLLLNPPDFPNFSRAQRSPAVIKSGTLYYPIWLSYATGVIEQAGHEALLIDAPASGYQLPEVLRIAGGFSPDLVVCDTSTPSIDNDVAVLESVKRAVPGAVGVLVGTHASARAAELLEQHPGIDAACRGEYEYTLRDLAESVASGDGVRALPGLVARRNGRLEEGEPREAIEDLDALPWVSPVYERFLPIRRYFYSIARHPVVTLVSGRGCPHGCTFCVYPQTLHGRRYRRRSPEDIVGEMLWVERHLPVVREIFLEDDTFTVDRAHVTRACELLRERGLRLPWTANSRCDVDLDTLRIMRTAGCRLLCVGVESGSQEILDNVGKGIRLERIEQFAEEARRAGILVHGCFMVGNPGETRETMEQTFRFALRLGFDTAQFFPLMVYPGTKAYDWAQKNGYLRTEDYRQWLDKEGCHNCVIDLPGLPAEQLVRFCDRARRRYYIRPSYLLQKSRQIVACPGELKRIAKAAKTFSSYLARRG